MVTSPFYFDRITFELDIMAPVGKTLRKAIDINCAAGDWAMVKKNATSHSANLHM